VLRPILPADKLRWDDYATWNDTSRRVTWRMEPHVLPGRIRCSGQNEFFDEDEGTRIRVSGQLTVSLDGVRAAPRLLRSKLQHQIEKLIVQLVEQNCLEINAAIARWLQSDERATRSRS
jgi:hypothetical protein